MSEESAGKFLLIVYLRVMPSKHFEAVHLLRNAAVMRSRREQRNQSSHGKFISFKLDVSSQGNSAVMPRVGQENLALEFVFVTVRFQLAGCPTSMFPKSISFLFIMSLTAK